MVESLIHKPSRREFLKFGAGSLAGLAAARAMGQASATGRSFGLPPCWLEVFTGFEGGTNGSAATNAILAANTFGAPLGILGVNQGTAAAITWQTAAAMPLQAATHLLCGYEQGSLGAGGTMGVRENGGGGNASNFIAYTVNDANFPVVAANVWFYSNQTTALTNSIDVFEIAGIATDYCNVQFICSGGLMYFQLETALSTANAITYTTGTWVNLQLLYVSGGTNKLAVFNTSGAQIGSTLSVGNTGSSNVENVLIGHLGAAQSYASTFYGQWDSLQAFFGTAAQVGYAFPGLPQ